MLYFCGYALVPGMPTLLIHDAHRPAAGRRLWSALALLIILQGCTSVGGPGVARQVNARIATAQAAATQHEERNELFAAMQQWLLVDALQPGHPSARTRAGQLQQQLAAQSQQLAADSAAARRKGQHTKARKLMLAAIAAQPADPILRASFVKDEQARQLGRLGRSTKRPAGASRDDAQALNTAAVPLSAKARKAEALYERAIAALESDLEAARALFQQVLDTVPTHLGARAYLESLP